jgi:hypothetical protein
VDGDEPAVLIEVDFLSETAEKFAMLGHQKPR